MRDAVASYGCALYASLPDRRVSILHVFVKKTPKILAARASSGLTQAQVAGRIGTTQSAVARLESGAHKHSPSISTLQRYARALGYRLDVRAVKERE
jgi:DNA-binding XRE family transcriptional regulator